MFSTLPYFVFMPFSEKYKAWIKLNFGGKNIRIEMRAQSVYRKNYGNYLARVRYFVW